MSTYKIVLITSGQPSLNPRLVKEADALIGAGYDVTVLYAYWNDWATRFDEELLRSKKWKAVKVGGDPSHKLVYSLSRLVFKVATTANRFSKGMLFPERAIARSSGALIRAAKKIKADLYIGHNLGALAAAVKAAKLHSAHVMFDAEDFHRNETANNLTDIDVILKTRLEDKYLPQLTALTVSSPQIANQYKEIYPQKHPQVILNVFPKTNITPPGDKVKNPIRLFWVSQTIGSDRGLEAVLQALQQFAPGCFELHLLGYASQQIKASFSGPVFFHDPVPPDEIISFASQFDIGLATETGEPYNRDICLTNKLFIYIQAGLAVVASDTAAQREFLAQYPVGRLYKKNNYKSLGQSLSELLNNPGLLPGIKANNYQLGHQTLNWGMESSKFLKLVQSVLDKG